MTRTTKAVPGVALGLALLVTTGAAGCGGKRHAHTRPWSPVGFPHSIAIAPLANDTLSIEGPKILRVRLRRALAAHGYQTQPLGVTDDHLRGIGITLGGQVPATPWEEMRDALGTDAVLTGRLIKHSAIVAGVVNTRTVEAEVVLTDLRTGQILWHARDKVVDVEDSGIHAASQAKNANEGLALCLIGTVCGLISGASQHDMRQENEQLAHAIARRAPLPGPPMVPVAAPVAVAAAEPMSADAKPLANKPEEKGETSLAQLSNDARTGAMPRPEAETVVEAALASAPAPTAPLPAPSALSAHIAAIAPKGAGSGQIAVPASALKPEASNPAPVSAPR